MTNAWNTLILVLAAVSVVRAQPTPEPASLPDTPSRAARAYLADALTSAGEDDNKKDPAFKSYKGGYNAILDERWSEAIQKFSDLVSEYPKSEYADDAQYWKAYALSHVDRKKAVAAYERFMEKYPKSRYIDDAVADLGNINSLVIVTSSSGDSIKVVASHSPHGYAYSVAPKAELAQSQMKKAEAMLNRQMRSFSFRFNNLRIPPMTTFHEYELEKLDPDTKLRVEALEAIAGSKDDEKAFRALKETALDRTQPQALRNVALESLTEFKKFDVLPIYIDLAKHDTSEKIQSSALYCISDLKKEKAAEVLADLFNTTSPENSRKRQTILFLIADVGNDKAVDFLVNVARKNEDYELRSDAVYYLGNIGGEKARTALYEILRNK